MTILCKLFGHKQPLGWLGGPKYFDVVPRTVDGLGTEHAELYCECSRCDTRYLVGKVHLPGRLKEKRLQRTVEFLRADREILKALVIRHGGTP